MNAQKEIKRRLAQTFTENAPTLREGKRRYDLRDYSGAAECLRGFREKLENLSRSIRVKK